MLLSPGAKLGPYQVLGTIGAGGVGEVYRARDTVLKRDVAIKILAGSYLNDPEKLRQFYQEAEAAAALNHPNILSIYQIGEQDGVPYIVTELLQGKTLRDYRGDHALPYPKALDYALQIAHGLAAAHAKRIVHRDLKPDNLFVTDDGRVKILDFGLAELLPVEIPSDSEAPTAEHTVPSGKIIGTLRYMAPEQVRGQRADARSDIFAFGAILYEMLTGKRAFGGESFADTIGAIVKENPPPLSQSVADVPPGLERIVFRCLEKSPEQRFQSASDLAFALEELTDTRTALRPAAFASISRRGSRALLIALTVVAFVAVVLGIWRSRGSLGSVAEIRSIAVLPFENVSGDASQDYFVEGMTDELTTELANIGALRVVSRTSAMRYKSSAKTLPEIARELRVDGVVEGSVLRSNGTVRITTQLVEARTDKQLWARSYSRQLSDIVRLQNELARDIADEIRIAVTPQERQRLANTQPVSPEVHESYLKGRYHLNQGTENQLRLAKSYFEQAIQDDANYAPAYAGLADYYWLTNELPPQVAIPKEKEYAQKAISLDENLADAHATFAAVKYYGDWDWAGADEEFKRAIELSPSNAEIHRMYAAFLSEMGRTDQALAEIRTALEFDPVSVITNVSAGWAYYYARQYDRALEECRSGLELDAQSLSAHDCIGSAFLEKGLYSQALQEYQSLVTASGDDPSRLASLGRAYALIGRKADAQDIASKLKTAGSQRYLPPYFLGLVYTALDDKEMAFSSLEHAYQQHDAYLPRLKVEPALDRLRADPRFNNLLHRMNL
ncbi:MAG: protein kinase [Acidobacteriaceae bacterium]|nr:protein kinase [Acidobacteriaceae bacterium]